MCVCISAQPTNSGVLATTKTLPLVDFVKEHYTRAIEVSIFMSVGKVKED